MTIKILKKKVFLKCIFNCKYSYEEKTHFMSKIVNSKNLEN